jgi:hypothetical protein
MHAANLGIEPTKRWCDMNAKSLEHEQQEMLERQRQKASRTSGARNEESKRPITRVRSPKSVAESLLEGEPWVSATYIAEKYSVSYSTARRMIMAVLGDDKRWDRKIKRGGKRSKRIRRLPESKLPELEKLMNN